MSKRTNLVVVLAVTLAAGGLSFSEPRRPPKNPADIAIEVSPPSAPAGTSVDVTLTVTPKAGIKISRYPQIKLAVAESAGLVGAAETKIGSSTPPPPDKLASNYWKEVDPIKLSLEIAPGAKTGAHEIEGKLTYYFCVSGDFCAPARVPVKIPVRVD